MLKQKVEVLVPGEEVKWSPRAGISVVGLYVELLFFRRDFLSGKAKAQQLQPHSQEQEIGLARVDAGRTL